MPIRKGGGTGLINPHKGDGTGFTEIRKGDGTVLWSADSGPSLPSSAVHHWKFDEGSGGTVVDSIGNEDGSLNGPDWVSGSWEGSYALDGDGADDFVQTSTLGDYGSEMDSGWAVALTVEVSDTPAMAIGTDDGNGDVQFFIGFTNHFDPSNKTNRVQVGLKNSGATQSYTVQTNNDYADGNTHRVVAQGTGVTASDIEIYVDTNQDYYIERDDAEFTSFTDFPEPIDFFRHPKQNEELDGIIDNIIFYDDVLSTEEIQDDYDLQPWT